MKENLIFVAMSKNGYCKKVSTVFKPLNGQKLHKIELLGVEFKEDNKGNYLATVSAKIDGKEVAEVLYIKLYRDIKSSVVLVLTDDLKESVNFTYNQSLLDCAFPLSKMAVKNERITKAY